jgi:tRNA(Ile)-lysidine synthase
VTGSAIAAAEARVLDAIARAMRAASPFAALSVAYSGGIDSSVLLEALCRLQAKLALPPPRALHVDHGLEADSACWHAHCAEQCARRGIVFRSMRVDARARAGESPEAAAREARYRALAGALAAGEALCVAHHRDDQAVTVLLNLLRGSGVDGLAGMRAERALPPGRLLRPLLAVCRRDIEACAAAWDLRWVQDPSNARSRHPRNRLREQVLPLLEAIAPGAVAAIARSARLHGEAAATLNALARADLLACRSDAPDLLCCAALARLPPQRRLAALRVWLRDAGVRPPGEARLREAARQLVTAGPDRAPRIVWSEGELRAGAGRVAFLRGAAAPRPAAEAAWDWQPGTVLELPAGRLSARPRVGAGLSAAGPLQVRLRRGGERCRPAGRAHSQTLKRLLQERQVPAWERCDLPLLYRDGVLVAVADLWVCHGHAAGAGAPGWQLCWEPTRGRAVRGGAA